MVNISDSNFESFKMYVEEELDFSITYYNDDYIRRRLRSRIRKNKKENLALYMDYLRESNEEQEDLIRSLSINVTGFFRNQEVWNTIRELLVEKTQNKDNCRVWSAGCADGREPYSIALMSLVDNKIDDEKVEIVGTDINTDALTTATQGAYPETITDKINEQLSYLKGVNNYIVRDENKVLLTNEVKEKVEFVEHDLIRDEVPYKFDIVLCRNVLIYLKRKHEREIVTTLAGAMRDNGYLVIGKADTLPYDLRKLFRDVNRQHRIYQYSVDYLE